jgi:hypothetical protein
MRRSLRRWCRTRRWACKDVPRTREQSSPPRRKRRSGSDCRFGRGAEDASGPDESAALREKQRSANAMDQRSRCEFVGRIPPRSQRKRASRKSPRNVGEREGGVVVGRPRQGRPAFRASILVGGANRPFKPQRVAHGSDGQPLASNATDSASRGVTQRTRNAVPRVSRKLLVHAADGRKGGNTCRRADAAATDHEVSPCDRPARDELSPQASSGWRGFASRAAEPRKHRIERRIGHGRVVIRTKPAADTNEARPVGGPPRRGWTPPAIVWLVTEMVLVSRLGKMLRRQRRPGGFRPVSPVRWAASRWAASIA